MAMEEHGGKFPPLLIIARMKIKKEKKGGNIKEKGGGRSDRGRKEKKRRKGRIFLAVRRSKLDNPRIKFIYTTRASRGYGNLGFSPNSKR